MIEGTTLTLNAGDIRPYFLLVHGNYLYAALWDLTGEKAKVVKIALPALTLVSTLEVYGADGRTSGLAISGDYLYVTVASPPGKIVKVNLSTFSVDSVLSLSGAENTCQAIAPIVVGGNLYADSIMGGAPQRLWEIDLSTFTETTFISGIAGSRLRSAYYDGHIYFGTAGGVQKIGLSPLAIVSTLFVGGIAGPLAIIGDFLFAVDLNTSPSKLYKVDLSTFTKVDEATQSSPNARDIFALGGFLYTTHYYSNKVIKTDPSDLSEVDVVTLSAAANNLVCITGNSLYVGSYTSPGRVTKVDVAAAPIPINRAYALAREEL